MTVAGGAPPIVFVHGTRLSGAMWTPQLRSLESDHRTIAVDLPGHGRLGERPFTLSGAADTVAEAIESVGGRAVVVGLSLGGYVSLELAARAPQRVAGLVLAGTTREPVGAWSLPYRGLARILGLRDQRRLSVFSAWYFRARYPPELAEPIIAGGFWFRGGVEALRSLLGERFVPRLAAYPGPTLIVNGALDPLFRLGERSFLAAAQDARRTILPRSGHLSNLDRPAAFTAAVRDLAGVVAGRQDAPAGRGATVARLAR